MWTELGSEMMMFAAHRAHLTPEGLEEGLFFKTKRSFFVVARKICPHRDKVSERGVCVRVFEREREKERVRVKQSYVVQLVP